MRVTARARKPKPQMIVQSVPLPASVSGWDGISPVANMAVDRAVQMDNWICRPGWLEPRNGFVLQSTGLGAQNVPVETLMPFNGFATHKLFGVAGGSIFDCTVTGAATRTTAINIGSSRMQYVMFSNAADTQYLVAVNGTGAPWLYTNGAWTQSAITQAPGSNPFDPTLFIGVMAYQGRLWFVQNNSTDPVYMTTVGAVTGPAFSFPLGQLMTKGGYLMAIGSWTVDTRQSVDEYIAFITSRGEVIVYQGTDPSTSNTWTEVGIYSIGPPIGRRCFLRIAGDLQVITIDGVVGMSEMLSTDRAAANRVSLTSIIMNKMAQAAQSYKNNFGWQLIEYPLGTLAILNIPVEENGQQMQFVMNTITGAWSRFIGTNPAGVQDFSYGINANCWAVDTFDNVYFGGNDGHVYQWNVGAGDNGKPITCVVQTAYNSFGNAAQFKRYTMIQPLITTTGNPIPSVGVNVDFNTTNVLSTAQPVTMTQPLWGQVKWNQFNWPGGPVTTDSWTGVQGMGHYVSIVTQITTTPTPGNPTATVDLQLNGWNIIAESGAYV